MRILFLLLALSFAKFSFSDDISTISRGGMLYDRWYEVISVEKPTTTHRAWPKTNQTKKGPTTHRCKSCHGWDYKGKDGAYANGPYQTGIPGISSFLGGDKNEVIEIITNDVHNFSNIFSDQDLDDLANFVVGGQVDFDDFINRETNRVKTGNSTRGEAYYNTVCAKCHGASGDLIEDMTKLGVLAHRNPWEVLHKIINGQAGEKMPSMRAFGMEVVMDIMAYVQTLDN